MLDAALLTRTATVVRQRSHIFDRADRQAGLMKGLNGGFPAAARSIHLHFDFANTEFLRLLGTNFGSSLGRERGALTASFEAHRSCGSPGQHISVPISDRHEGVVEAALDMHDPLRHVATRSLLLGLAHGPCDLASRGVFDFPGDATFSERVNTLMGFRPNSGVLLT